MSEGDPSATTVDPRVLLLAAEDNVLIACTDLAGGTELVVGGRKLTLERDVPTGHKLARTEIAAGDKVRKYGAPIGSARDRIAPGAYVHTHNLQSDYIPTWDREGHEMR